jgi:bifunctional non-homologous end joining protein LigD
VDAALRKGDLKFRLDGYKLKGSWVLVRTRGFGTGSKPSWLLIKHRDDWAGPVDITEFAPLSVKTPDADFADILAADDPAVWTSNAPAKTGDTGKLFARIIAQAVAMKTGGAGERGNVESEKRRVKGRAATSEGPKKKSAKRATPGRAARREA